MPRTRTTSRRASGWAWASSALAALLAAAVAAACGGDDPCDSLTGPAVVTSVEVRGPDGAIAVGTTAQFQAVARSACGAAVGGVEVSWLSTNPQVASVSPTGVVTGVAVGEATIQATSEGQTGSSPVEVDPAPVAQVEVVPDAAAIMVDDTVRFAVVLRDGQGNVLTGRDVAWTSEAPAVASVAATGLARGLTPGTAPIVATAEGVSGSGTLTVSVRPPPRLAFEVQPVDTRVGEAITPAVRVRITTDGGALITDDDGGPILLALAENPGGATLRGTLSATTVNGIATFANVSLDRAGNGYRLRASRADAVPATSTAFNVDEGDPASLAFTVGPTSVVAGAAMSPAVEVAIRDEFGSLVTGWDQPVTIALASGPGGATLGGTTQVQPVNGIARFTNLRLETAGTSYTLRASTGGLNVTSGAFTVSPAAGAALVFSVQPADAGAGEEIAPPVQVRVHDAFGNLVTGWSQPVVLTLTGAPEGATLGGTTSRTPSGGIATYDDLVVEAAGTDFRLRAASGALPQVQSAAFDVTAGAAASITFDVQPSNAAAGVAIAPAVVVRLRDASGNPVAGSPQVTMTLEGAGDPGLLGTTVVTAANGVATFANLRIEQAGTGYRLRASAAGLEVLSAPFDVSAAAGASLHFTAQPADVGAGATLPPVSVQVRDAFGNVAGGWGTPVALTLTGGPGGGTLGGTTSRAPTSGTATFSDLQVDAAGTGYRLQASSGALPAAQSDVFDVTAGAIASITFEVEPQDALAGVPMVPAVVVHLRDAVGNPVAGTPQVTMTLENAGGAALLGTTQVPAANGVATFSNLRIEQAGLGYRLRASASGLEVQSTAFGVSAAAGATLHFTAQPADTDAGATLPPVAVQVRDAFGNVASTWATPVALELIGGPGGGTLGGTTVRAPTAGTATFDDLEVGSAGSGYQLRATSGGLPATESSDFSIAAGPTASVSFLVQPAGAVAGAVIAPPVVVAVLDASGNPAGGAPIVSLELIDAGGAPLLGTTAVVAADGLATFPDLRIEVAGSDYRLRASADGHEATSDAFAVAAAVRQALGFTQQPPPEVDENDPFEVAVGVLDSFGNTVTSSGDVVTLAFGSRPHPSALLLGTLVRITSEGRVAFPDLQVTRDGNGATLVASAPGLVSTESRAFRVRND